MNLISFKLEKRTPPSWWFRMLMPIMAVIISLAISSIFLLALRKNPFTAFYYLFYGGLGTKFAFLEMLVKATPLILTGIAVSIAFLAKYWNIGAEGQLYAGALLATWVGIQNFNLSPFFYVSLVIIAGFVGGGVWSFIPAYLKAKFKVDDVVTTLLMNYIMIYFVSAILTGPWRNPVSMWPESVNIAENARLIQLVPRSRVHIGFLIAVAVVFVAYFIVKKTKLGFEIRATGSNPKAANFLGINTLKTIIIASVLSGGVAGLAGVSEVAGVHYHLIQNLSPGYGYSGIVIAMLGGLNPFGVLFAALYFSVIITGAQMMSRSVGIPPYIADVIQGITLIVMLAMLLLFEYKISIRRGK
mgnify:CR=1 FL=1